MMTAKDFFKDRALWNAACEADGISPNSLFVRFSPGNIAAERSNNFRAVLVHLMCHLDPSIA